MTTSIDYQKIADAQQFYAQHGFVEIPVPWIIDFRAYQATRPSDRQEFYTLGGYLNASGEQSFLQLMQNGTPIGRQMCITPCFRQEPILDDLHQRYFMKLELIDTRATKENLKDIISICQNFFSRYLATEVIVTSNDQNSFDIVDSIHGVELGSYGIRHHQEFQWIYATGIALPRLDTALNKLLLHV